MLRMETASTPLSANRPSAASMIVSRRFGLARTPISVDNLYAPTVIRYWTYVQAVARTARYIALLGRTPQRSAFPKHFGSCTAETSVSDEPEGRIEIRNRLVVAWDVKIPMR